MNIKTTIKLTDFTVVQLAIVTLIIISGLLYYIFGYQAAQYDDSLFVFLRLLDVGAEQSIPTYFSTLNLLLSSLLLFIIFIHEKENRHRGKNYWIYLSILFLLLSIDESSSIHEKFAIIYYKFSQSGIIPGLYVTRNWLPFGLLFIIINGLVLLPFLKLLPTASLYRFLVSGIIFIIGVIGFEFLGSIMIKTGYVDSNKELIYLIRRILEEGFEMYGIAIFNCALFGEISNKKISLTFVSS